jgi:hypothetical protein
MSMLLDTLDEIGKEVNKVVPYLNCGGCGVYAAIVSEKLQNLNIDCWGIISSYDDLDLDEIKKNNTINTVKDWNHQGVIIKHILVQFKHRGQIWTHDSCITISEVGMTDPTSHGIICKGKLSVEEMRKLADCKEGWNEWFNRNTIPEITNIVDSFFVLLNSDNI